MTRQSAYQILTKYLTNPNLIKHSLAAEAVMRALAVRLKSDPEVWGITGLLHDADYDRAKGHPEEHGLLLFKLEPNTIPSNIEYAIKAHNFEYTKFQPKSLMDWSIYCCDQLTGLIVAAALVHPDKKLVSITPEFIMKRMSEKSFAKGARREPIYLCQEKLGIPLQEFVTIALAAMQTIAPELGL